MTTNCGYVRNSVAFPEISALQGMLRCWQVPQQLRRYLANRSCTVSRPAKHLPTNEQFTSAKEVVAAYSPMLRDLPVYTRPR